MNNDPSPMYQARKKLLVEKALWECVEVLLDNAPGIDPKDEQGLKDWATRCLQSFEHLGYARCERDQDGNLSFWASPKLLAETGKELGPLQWRGYCLDS
jgi:hypothetical protein